MPVLLPTSRTRARTSPGRTARTPDHAVLIAGGGPTGLMLAAELALAKADVAIVERRASQDLTGTRAGGLHARSIEILDQRGVADRFLREGTITQLAGFAWTRLDIGDLPTRHPYGLALRQSHIERILADWVEELHVPIYRGREVGDVVQDDTGVDVTLASGEMLRTNYLVGCDGGRSLVRRLLGVAFPGEPARTEWLLGEVEVTTPAEEVAAISEEVRKTHRGFGIGPASDGLFRAVVPAASVAEDRTVPPTLDEFRTQLRAYAGTDFGAHSPRALSRFTDATRLADRYRDGRVLLAGDAAHVHPPLGGQGLNLGIQDAFNLGWKLATEVSGRAPDGLLDSYESERRPVAEQVLTLTRAQSVLIDPDPGPQAVRRLLTELMGVDGVALYLAEQVSGLGIHYDLGDGPALLGRRLRDLPLPDGRLYERLRDGRGLLLDRTGRLSVVGWGDRVGLVADADLPIGEPALLLRPDGHVAWIGDRREEPADALLRWFGPPA